MKSARDDRGEFLYTVLAFDGDKDPHAQEHETSKGARAYAIRLDAAWYLLIPEGRKGVGDKHRYRAYRRSGYDADGIPVYEGPREEVTTLDFIRANMSEAKGEV